MKRVFASVVALLLGLFVLELCPLAQADTSDKAEEHVHIYITDSAFLHCRICGYEEAVPQEHEHVYNSFGYDEDKHYSWCYLCGEEFQQVHAFTVRKPYMIKIGDQYIVSGMHHTYCEVCRVPGTWGLCAAEDGAAPFQCSKCAVSFGQFVFQKEEEHEETLFE